MQNNYAFIDGENLYQGVTNDIKNLKTGKIIYKGWKLNYKKFRQYLKDKYNITKAFLFIGYIKGNESLYTMLQNAGFILVFKDVMEIKKEDGKITHKGNVDAELVLYSMIEYNNYEKAVIVSNDGDFYCLVKYLDDNKKLLKIISPNGHYSKLLGKYSNKMVIIKNLRKSLELTKKN